MKAFDKRMTCFQGVIDSHILYAILESDNAICEVDLLNKKIKIKAWLDAESELSCDTLYYAVAKYNDYLIAIPGAASKLCIYNIKLNKISYIEIPESAGSDKGENSSVEKFWRGLAINNCFYYFGYGYPFIMKLEIDTLNIELIDLKVIDRTDCSVIDEERYLEGSVIYEEDIYAPSSASGNIVALNYQTNTVRVYRNISDNRRLHGIIVVFKEIWLITTKDHRSILSKWNPQGGILDDIFIEESLQEEIYWWNPLQVGSFVYLFQLNGNKAYRIDIQNKEVLSLDEITSAIGEIPDLQGKYWVRLVGNDGDIIYFCTSWNRKWFSYNTVTRKTEGFFIEVEDEELKKRYWNRRYSEYNLKGYVDEKEVPLDIFLTIINK